MLECGFCGHMLSRRNWHSSSEYKKVIWQCVNATKNGKKYCPHSKGIEEEAIEKAFMESYRQVCHNNVEITNEFLKTVEDSFDFHFNDYNTIVIYFLSVVKFI